MSEQTLSHTLRASGRAATAVTVASYAILGSILCLTRFIGLDRSYWHDEIVTIEDYVRRGPSEILTGAYYPNNHELFNLLAWATSSAVGESEIVLRLWSVIPFILGVILVSAWLHTRVGALSGILFLFLATASPLLLDISRQARGYGLAFLAMSILIVAALEAESLGRTREIVAFCAAGLVGTWTLPNFGIAFVATGAVLLTNPHLRRSVAVGLGASILAICAWYAPHVTELWARSGQAYGVQIDTAGVVTAPIDQILIPALVWIDGTVLIASLVWLPVVAVAVLLIGSSPLLRRNRSALVLGSCVLATVVVVWVARLHIAPRFFSFLLVPLLILLASGMASILARITTRPPPVRTVIALITLVLLAVGFSSSAARVTRLPREAHKGAAAVIRSYVSPSIPVFAHVWRPRDLRFYLERPVKSLRAPSVAARVCHRGQPVVLVEQPFDSRPQRVSCLRRQGVRHHRFEQYTRGGEINVWFIPPSPRRR